MWCASAGEVSIDQITSYPHSYTGQCSVTCGQVRGPFYQLQSHSPKILVTIFAYEASMPMYGPRRVTSPNEQVSSRCSHMTHRPSTGVIKPFQ